MIDPKVEITVAYEVDEDWPVADLMYDGDHWASATFKDGVIVLAVYGQARDRSSIPVRSVIEALNQASGQLTKIMGSAMKPYTDLPGFEAVVLEKSYVLGIQATAGTLTLDVDLALTPEHPVYAPPPATETDCFRRGRIRFVQVQRLVWDAQGAPPATDASGEVDFGHIHSLKWDGNAFKLEGDWGRIEVSAARAEVEVPA
jgi:hypothetical protein